MDHVNEKHIAIWIKDGRLRKGYTQQELADLTGISIRSVQRIENGEVIPREYTLRLLAKQLELKEMMLPSGIPRQPDATPSAVQSPVQPEINIAVAPPTLSGVPSSLPHGLNKPRKLILSIGTGLLLILGTAAFIAQSPRFPETTFEAFCLWSVITLVYTVCLYRVWK